MLPPNSSSRLLPVARRPPRGRRARSGSAAEPWRGSDGTETADRTMRARTTTDPVIRRPDGMPALQVVGVDGQVDERERAAGRARSRRSSPRRRRLRPQQRPRGVGAPIRCRKRTLIADAAGRARHRQVDELDRRLRARRREAAEAALARLRGTRSPPATKVSWARITPTTIQATSALAKLVRRSCRIRSSRAG